ncbi:MAG: hypothetical protein WBC71_01875 [Salaquimonas sp.]
MADYISILDKAVSGLAENTPDNRSIIYGKARAAIERKLRAMDPLPSEDAIGRQLGQLENAITQVEGEYAAVETALPTPAAEPSAPVPQIAPEPIPAPTPDPVETSPAAVTGSVAPSPGFVDDLILIDGIGEKTSSLLAEQGITGISQIADMSDEELASVTEKIGFPGFELTQEWKAQSQAMLEGELPRGKTDQARLEKLRETGEGLIIPHPVSSSIAETASVAPDTIIPSVPSQPGEPIAAPSSPAPLPPETPAMPEMPKVTAPNITKPEIAIPTFDAPKAASVEVPSVPEPSPVEQVLVAETAIPTPPPSTAASAVEAALNDLMANEQAKQSTATTQETTAVAPAAPYADKASAPLRAEPVAPAPAPSLDAPEFVTELENDPARSPANDPYLERTLKTAAPKKGGAGKALATGSILVLLGAAATGAYVYREPLMQLGNQGVEAVKELIRTKETAPASEDVTPTAGPETTPAAGTETDTTEKDVARLGADGSQTQEPITEDPVDIVPATSVETTPVAPLPPAAEEAETPATVEVQEETPAPGQTAQVEEQAPAQQETAPVAILNGEKSYLYEEALGTTGANRDEGSIVWSLVNEAPEAGSPPEAVIKGVMEIPARGLTMNMSIKRNVDAGLPASHIIELFFDAPGEFSGGNIDGISRFVMKTSEQARGESLVGVPARIDTGFFLIALNNLQQAQTTNLQLMENSDWVDIPVSYVTGRRALLTFEKGESGKQVFSQALADWKNR